MLLNWSNEGETFRGFEVIRTRLIARGAEDEVTVVATDLPGNAESFEDTEPSPGTIVVYEIREIDSKFSCGLTCGAAMPPIRLNVQGADVLDDNGREWIGEQRNSTDPDIFGGSPDLSPAPAFYKGGNLGNFTTLADSPVLSPDDVAGLEDEQHYQLYQMERWSSTPNVNNAHAFTYTFPVPNDLYLVKLHTADMWCGTEGAGSGGHPPRR